MSSRTSSSALQASPDKRSPCSRGKTMRDFEEELADLKRENFDLKMRIYIMEEQQDLFEGVENMDEIYQLTTSLKKELECLRKELSEKDDLVVKAGDAMNMLVNKHKEEVGLLRLQAQEEVENYREKMEMMQQELIEIRDKSMIFSQHSKLEDSSIMYQLPFALANDKKSAGIVALTAQIAELESELNEKNKQLEESIKTIDKLSREIISMKDVENNLRSEIVTKGGQVSILQGELAERDIDVQALQKKITTFEANSKDNKEKAQSVQEERLLTLELQKLQLEKEQSYYQKLRSKYDATREENEQLSNQIVELHKKLNEFQIELQARGAVNMDLHQQLDLLKSRNSGLQEEESNKAEYEDLKKKLMDVEKERDMLQIVMEQQIQKLLNTLKEKEHLLQEFKTEGKQNSDKELRIGELERQVANLKMEIGSTISSETVNEDIEKKKLYNELEEKKKEIEHLNEELRKRTFNLQELVNTELWDKNREIEKLNKVCEKKQVEVINLKNQMHRQEEELALLNGKMQELNDHISQNIIKISDKKDSPVSYREKYFVEVEEKNEMVKEIENWKEKYNNEFKKNEELAKECLKWKEEAEQHDKSRKELFNACTSLMTRLEELATFLDSLLPLLGAKKRRILQQVIDRSREASRSLSISFLDQSIISNISTTNISAVPILPDFSQVDFCSEDDTLDITLVTKEEIDDQNAEVVQIREQVESMVEKLKEVRLSPEKKRKELKSTTMWSLKPQNTIDKSMDSVLQSMECIALEDITEGSLLESFESDIKEDTRQNVSTVNERKSPNRCESVTTGGADKVQDRSVICSESEGWSEPDRNVSLARIGIREEISTIIPSSDESSDCFPKPFLSSSNKKRHEEIRRLSVKVKHLEKLNGSLLAELRKRENIISPNHITSNEKQIDGLVTKTLLDEIKKQREKLQASLSHNEFIRNQLEGALTYSIGEIEGKKNLIAQLREMSVELERSCSLCMELERRCIALETERTSLKEAAENLRAEAVILKANLKEKENEALEAQCSLLDVRNKHLLLENASQAADNRAKEAAARVLLLENRITDIDISLKEAQEGWAKAATSWEQEKRNLIDAHSKEVTDLRTCATKMKSDYEKSSYEQRLSLERVHKKLEELLLKRSLADNEWKQRLDSLEKEKKQELDEEIEKRMDLERKLVISYEKQSELRSRLDAEMTKTREIETSHKTLERWWRRRMEEAEGARAEREAELRRRLDAAALTTSEAVLDRTRLANDRLRLQAELRRRDDIAHEVKTELERRVAELEAANRELECKMSSLHSQHICSDTELQFPVSPKSPTFLLNRQRSNPTSDYTSDPDHHGSNGNLWFPVCGRSNNNASPDLGIESDQGRLSSLDAVTPISPKATHNGEIGKLELENNELRGKLQRTRKALEETFAQLNAANQRKRQVERAICKQLSKTHYILQKARTNLESSDHVTTSTTAQL